MNNLSKSQKDEYATAFAMLALYDGGVRSEIFLINVFRCFTILLYFDGYI